MPVMVAFFNHKFSFVIEILIIYVRCKHTILLMADCWEKIRLTGRSSSFERGVPGYMATRCYMANVKLGQSEVGQPEVGQFRR